MTCADYLYLSPTSMPADRMNDKRVTAPKTAAYCKLITDGFAEICATIPTNFPAGWRGFR